MFNKLYGTVIRIIISFCLVSDWLDKGVNCFDPCMSFRAFTNISALDFCEDNTVNATEYVYASTGIATLQQSVECKCTVKPSDPSTSYTLHASFALVFGAESYSNDSLKFSFIANNVTLFSNIYDVGYAYIDSKGDTDIAYSSPNNPSDKLCVFIRVISHTMKWSIVCSKPLTRIRTEQNPVYTTSTMHTTEQFQESQTASITAIYVCTSISVFAMVVILILVVVFLIYYERKAKERNSSNDLNTGEISNESGRGDNVYQRAVVNANQAHEHEYTPLGAVNNMPDYINN